jgi:hypothetical protein
MEERLIASLSEQLVELQRENARLQGKVGNIPLGSDRAVLCDIFRRSGGDAWKEAPNWRNDAPLSEWYGVTAEGETVVEFCLYNNNLAHKLSPAIGQLRSLRWIDVSGNRFACQIVSAS